MTTRDMDYGQDDRTVILDRNGAAPAQSPLTDFSEPPRYEQLEERMIYAARLRPAESFNASLNPLVAAASALLSEVVRLKHSFEAEDLQALHRRLSADLKLFEHRSLHEGAESSQAKEAVHVLEREKGCGPPLRARDSRESNPAPGRAWKVCICWAFGGPGLRTHLATLALRVGFGHPVPPGPCSDKPSSTEPAPRARAPARHPARCASWS